MISVITLVAHHFRKLAEFDGSLNVIELSKVEVVKLDEEMNTQGQSLL